MPPIGRFAVLWLVRNAIFIITFNLLILRIFKKNLIFFKKILNRFSFCLYLFPPMNVFVRFTFKPINTCGCLSAD